MKLKIKPVLSIVFLVVLIVLFVYYVNTHFSDFKQLRFVEPYYIAFLVLITLVLLVSNGVLFKYLLEPFGVRLRSREWMGLSAVTNFYNTITPFRGGMAVRAMYLRHRHKFSFSDFIGSLSGTYVLEIFIFALLGLLSLGWIYLRYGISNWIVSFVFIGAFVPMLIIILFSPTLPETRYKWINFVVRAFNGWNTIRHNKRILLTISSIVLFQLIVSSIGTKLSYAIFGIDVTFVQALFLVCIGSLAILVQITPGGLGIAEAVAVFSALVIGIGPPQALAVALLNRAVGTVVILVLGPIFSYVLFKHVSSRKALK